MRFPRNWLRLGREANIKSGFCGALEAAVLPVVRNASFGERVSAYVDLVAATMVVGCGEEDENMTDAEFDRRSRDLLREMASTLKSMRSQRIRDIGARRARAKMRIVD